MQIAVRKISICSHPPSNCDLPALLRSVQLVAYCVGLSLLMAGAPGCAKSSGIVAVHGRVSYRGESLSNASLTLFPTTGRPETARVVDGQYACELPPGDYTVVVNIGSNLPPGYKEGDPPPPPPKIVLPDEYSVRTKSKLKASVKADQDQPIDFDLK
jgi:hypothetical protein